MRFKALTLETATRSATDTDEFAFLPNRPLPSRAGQGGLIIVAGGGAKPLTFAADIRTGRILRVTQKQNGNLP